MVSLKLIIHKETQKLIYAEAGKDFTDFLCHIPSLPIGSFLSLQENQKQKDHPHDNNNSDDDPISLPFGILPKLYQSIKNLKDQNFLITNLTIKNSVSLQSSLQAIFNHKDVHTTTSNTGAGFYFDHGVRPPLASLPPPPNYLANLHGHLLPHNNMNNNNNKNKNDGMPSGGYVIGTSTYIIMDDLHVAPMSTVSCMTLLNEFGALDPTKVEEKVVQVGVNEAISILKSAMVTRNVLTSVFLEKCKSAKEEDFIMIKE